jgi:hypothetical protein
MKKKQSRDKAAPIRENELASAKGASGFLISAGDGGSPDPADGGT